MGMFDRFVPMNTQATSRYIGSPYEAELKTLAQLKQQADETTALQQDTELGYMYANVDPHDKDAWEQGVIAPTKAKLASATATPEFGVQAAKYTAKEFAAKQNLFKNEQAKRQQTSKQIDDMVEKKVISSKRADETRMLNRHFDKGMQYDPTTGKFSSTYNPILPVEEYDMTKAVKDIVPLLHQRGMLQAKNPDGTIRTLSEQEVVEIGNRWITKKSVKSFGVDEVALGKAFSALIANDPKFQADIQFQKHLRTYKITPEAVAAAKFNPQVEAQLQAAEQKGIPRHIALRSMVENQIDTEANNRLAMLAQSFAWQDSSEKTDVKENPMAARADDYRNSLSLQNDRQAFEREMETTRTANDIMINAYKDGGTDGEGNSKSDGYTVAPTGSQISEEKDFSYKSLQAQKSDYKSKFDNVARQILSGNVDGVKKPWSKEDVIVRGGDMSFRGRKTDETVEEYNTIKKQFDLEVANKLIPLKSAYKDTKNRIEKYYFNEDEFTPVEKTRIAKRADELLKAGRYDNDTVNPFNKEYWTDGTITTKEQAMERAKQEVMKDKIEQGDARAKLAGSRSARLGLALLPDEKTTKHEQAFVDAALGQNVSTSGMGLLNRDGSNFDEELLKKATGGAKFRGIEYNPNTGELNRVVELFDSRKGNNPNAAGQPLGRAYMKLNSDDYNTVERKFGTYGVEALRIAGQMSTNSKASSMVRMPNGKIIKIELNENTPGTEVDYTVKVGDQSYPVANNGESVTMILKGLLENEARKNQ